ncbi:hypothetical protein [Pseudosporangium ferrugineum]|uniref:Uncharacterized protein n=1 Tax=Pseudosporangium ferrugineum TaxID=439699 RepID=A0A2T0SA10_9ACTN|nr:hypothetical protein [Pseudosporangium ferrugineum]PRY30246.1 hypothetical protein CLV70_105416 [Pseudosporangium ferrugineum]
MTIPQDSAGFLARPVDAVAGLLPDRRSAEAAVAALRGAGFQAVDASPHHPGRCRLRDWGGDTTIMNLYVEGLHKGHSVVIVPTPWHRREEAGRLLARHQGHAVYYFAADGVESLSVFV